MICSIFKFLLSFLFILVSVAFFTLLERKIMGYMHLRFGPNKVFLSGLFQPFSDAIKLFSKEDLNYKDFNMGIYFFSPLFFLILSIFFWGIVSFWGILFFSKYSLVIFICFLGLGVYFLLFKGWSSNSKFSLLGGCRSSAQSISYEVIMIFCVLFFSFLWFTLGFFDLFFLSFFLNLLGLVFILSFSWFVSCLAECNRSPFDFSEGESELVSGFNTEYSGGFFSFIFIGEYSSLLLLSFVSSLFLLSPLLFYLFFMFVCFIFLWVRCSFPRLRYDFLMSMSWSGMTFLILSCYFFFFNFL